MAVTISGKKSAVLSEQVVVESLCIESSEGSLLLYSGSDIDSFVDDYMLINMHGKQVKSGDDRFCVEYLSNCRGQRELVSGSFGPWGAA